MRFCRSFNCASAAGVTRSRLSGTLRRSTFSPGRPLEDDLEVSHVGPEGRRLQSVVEHLVVHPAEAAASLLDVVEKGASSMMGKDLWAYQNVLTKNGVENKFDHFLHFLLGRLERKYGRTTGHSISEQIKLESSGGYTPR